MRFSIELDQTTADTYSYVATLEARIQTLEAQLQAANSQSALATERPGVQMPPPQEHVRPSIIKRYPTDTRRTSEGLLPGIPDGRTPKILYSSRREHLRRRTLMSRSLICCMVTGPLQK